MEMPFELLTTDCHPDLDHARAELSRFGGQVSAVPSDDWYQTLNRVFSGDWPGAFDFDWIVLADNSAPLSSADFNAIGDRIESTSASVWLQPWNSRLNSALYPWQNYGPQVATLWSSPASSAAVCLNHGGIRRIESGFEFNSEIIPADPIWDVLIRLVLRGQPIDFSRSEWATPWSGADTSVPLPVFTPTSDSVSDAWLKKRILPRKPGQLVVHKRSDADAVAVKAGICQWHGWLNDSHQLSQSVEGLGIHRSGDYWHAITHRREPDYANAKYWFRQLGNHAVFSELVPYVAPILGSVAEAANWTDRLLKGGNWDPFAFVDLCEACAGNESQPLAIAARRIQAVEMQLLMAATYRDAKGGK